MAAIRATTAMVLREMFARPLSPSPAVRRIRPPLPCLGAAPRGISFIRIRCAASGGAGEKRAPSRFAQVQQLLQEAEERALSAGDEPTPKITLDHVTVSFARSGGPGGQNVNKVNTKVDMRFNVKNAYWLSDRIRERIMQTGLRGYHEQDIYPYRFSSYLAEYGVVPVVSVSVIAWVLLFLEKNRINKDGEIVISSTKTRTQKGNVDDALGKLQAIIDAASYVPPPPSEEQKKKIAKMAATGEQKRLKSKKALSDKKAFRRSRDGWD